MCKVPAPYRKLEWCQSNTDWILALLKTSVGYLEDQKEKPLKELTNNHKHFYHNALKLRSISDCKKYRRIKLESEWIHLFILILNKHPQRGLTKALE